MSRPKRYTEGVMKIAVPPRLCNAIGRDDFLEKVGELGYEYASWSNEIYTRSGSSWTMTNFRLTDFEC